METSRYLDTLGRHILDNDSRKTDNVRNCQRVLDQGVLFGGLFHDLMHRVPSLLQNILEEDHFAFSRRHALDHAKGDVLARLAPVVAHLQRDGHPPFSNANLYLAEHVEQLSEVELLLGSDDVDHLIKLVLFEALVGGGDIAGDVERGAVRLADDRDTHALCGHVTDESALVVLCSSCFSGTKRAGGQTCTTRRFFACMCASSFCIWVP